MGGRRGLRATTMLSGIVGGVFLATLAARAADMPIYAPYAKAPPSSFAPAVDGFNVKVDGYGGTIANKAIYGTSGSVAMPLGGQYGFQIDGNAGSLDNDAFGAVGGHLFWRNPTQALFGIYGNSTFWDRFGGVNVNHVGGEAELYVGRITLQGVAGVEFGNTATQVNTGVVNNGALLATTTTSIEAFSIKTRFFDQINLKYYFNDDFSGYVGHRYLGGKNFLALGAELARPLGGGLMASLFAEGRVGENGNNGVWGGLKLYFGPTDKPLIERHRRDDPFNWSIDTGSSIFGGNHNGSSTSTTVCKGVIFNGVCEAGLL